MGPEGGGSVSGGDDASRGLVDTFVLGEGLVSAWFVVGETVKVGLVAACAINFVASVNDAFWFLLDCLEDCNFFFSTKFTSPRSECFVHGEGVALPKDFHGEVDVVLEFTSWGIFWDLFGKVVRKGIRLFVLENKGFRILHMLLHALLDCLLGAADVELV